jgi:hypothetical protein
MHLHLRKAINLSSEDAIDFFFFLFCYVSALQHTNYAESYAYLISSISFISVAFHVIYIAVLYYCVGQLCCTTADI